VGEAAGGADQRDALVAVGQRMVAHDARGEDRGALDRVLVEVVAAEARERGSESRLRERDLRDVQHLARVDAEDRLGRE